MTNAFDQRAGLFREEALFHRRKKHLSTVTIRQSFAVRFLAWSTIGLVCLALLVLCFIRYKETVSARGVLETKSPSQKIKSPVTAVVTLIDVAEGERVAKGQTVMTLSTKILNGNGEGQHLSKIKRLRLEKENLAQELIAADGLFKGELARLALSVETLENEQSSLRQEATLLAEKKALSSSQLESLRRLLKQSSISQSQFDIQLLNHLSIERDQNLVASKINAVRSDIKDGLLQSDLLTIGFENTQSKVISERLLLASEIRDLDQETTVSIQTLLSGVVASVAVEQGSAVSAGSTLLTILPNNRDLKATLFVPSSVIGKIFTEQELLLEFDAFPISEFGYTKAKVVTISTASLDPRETLLPVSGLNEPMFRVVAELEKHYVEGIQLFPLVSGMQFSANFVIENLSLLEFILKPVLQMRGKIL